jgi:nickel/cobalt transporter (NiCoT) family protein
MRLTAPPWSGYAAAVAAVHALACAALLHAAAANPILWGMGVLAYTLGLRHGFDVDHIAAIDNTIRKLAQEDENPLGVGFYFSMGHSTVVLLMALAAAFGARWSRAALPALRAAGGLIGPVASGAFLVSIGIINLFIWLDIYRGRHDAGAAESALLSRGVVARLTSPLLRMVRRSRQIYPVGFLFGLGFDTASEIALLALSAGAAAGALPWTGVAALPLLFAGGMSAVDTADGVFMTAAYRWAADAPARRVAYNLTVTAVSAAAALAIGGVELLQAAAGRLGWTMDGRGLAAAVFDRGGYVLVAIFALTWSSYGAWKIFKGRPARPRTTDVT